jgi:uncharacterized repeat protein (TIGR01451 family)
VETNSANNSDSDATTVLGPNISTSTKSVSDLNAGDANPGDTLRYTITINETAGVAGSGISVTDHVPGNTSGFSVFSLPLGATNSSTGNGTGNNGTGFLNITNISVPANGSVAIVFDVQVAAGTSPGATIANTATMNNPAGADPTPSSPTLIVSQSQIPGSGTKQLYLWSNGGNALSRTRPTGTHAAATILGSGSSATWQITPALALPITLQAGAFPVRLLIDNTGTSTNNSRNVTVRLENSVLGLLGTATLNQQFDNAALTSFNMTLAATVVAPAGSFFTLQITNNTTTFTRTISITPYSGANYSRVDLNSATVIEVESVNAYDNAYAGGTLTSNYMRGLSTVYIRAVVSDPFGSFDISSATVSLVNPASTTIVTAQAMTEVASNASTKTYEYAYAVPANAVAGAWTIRVTANEGVEGVNDLGVGQFTVTIPMPTLLISKISQVISDPVNGAANPKSIPGSIQRYTITVTNSGPGAVDSSSLAIADVLPTTVELYVATGGGDPVLFTNGITASGLTYNYATNVGFSNQPGGGAPYTYTPVPDANGFDSAITGVRVAPSGSMSAASGGNQPSFNVQFRVRIK